MSSLANFSKYGLYKIYSTTFFGGCAPHLPISIYTNNWSPQRYLPNVVFHCYLPCKRFEDITCLSLFFSFYLSSSLNLNPELTFPFLLYSQMPSMFSSVPPSIPSHFLFKINAGPLWISTKYGILSYSNAKYLSVIKSWQYNTVWGIESQKTTNYSDTVPADTIRRAIRRPNYTTITIYTEFLG